MEIKRFISVKEFGVKYNIKSLKWVPKTIEFTDKRTGEQVSKQGYYAECRTSENEIKTFSCSFNFDPDKTVQVRIIDEDDYPVTFTNDARIDASHLL
jgi:hypothetical protein